MMFELIGENNSNELCDTRKDQISMQRLLILCSAACKTEIIFDVVDISFDNSPCFIGVIPFFGSADRSGISAQILVAKTLVPLQDAVVWFISIQKRICVLILEQSAEPKNGITPIKSGLLSKEISTTSKIISVLQDVEPKMKKRCMLI